MLMLRSNTSDWCTQISTGGCGPPRCTQPSSFRSKRQVSWTGLLWTRSRRMSPGVNCLTIVRNGSIQLRKVCCWSRICQLYDSVPCTSPRHSWSLTSTLSIQPRTSFPRAKFSSGQRMKKGWNHLRLRWASPLTFRRAQQRMISLCHFTFRIMGQSNRPGERLWDCSRVLITY